MVGAVFWRRKKYLCRARYSQIEFWMSLSFSFMLRKWESNPCERLMRPPSDRYSTPLPCRVTRTKIAQRNEFCPLAFGLQEKEGLSAMHKWFVMAAATAVFVFAVIVYGTVLASNPADRNVPGA